jgi:endonuclease/exonuclease/phosphatase family metal-dependent hydrolase
MPQARIASLNVFGIGGRDVTDAIALAAQRLGPAQADVLALGFQEAFFRHQVERIRDAWLGRGQFCSRRGAVEVWQSQSAGAWSCLVPATPALRVPGFAFDSSSGLALCVQGRLTHTFYDRYRFAQAPDRFAYKGVLAALVVKDGVRRAFLTTHLNNSENDPAGRARAWQIEQLASILRYVDRAWRAPVCLLGDFNIDARAALLHARSLERILYARLLAAGRAPGAFLWDVNTRERLPNAPLRTSVTHETTIDLHLLDRTAGRSGLAFSTHAADSDHFLTESRWNEA